MTTLRPRRSPARWLRFWMPGLLAFTLACGQDLPPLEPVPLPDLSQQEAPTRERLSKVAGKAEAIRERDDAEPEDVARAYGDLGSHLAALGYPDAAALAFDNARRVRPEAHRWHYLAGACRQESSQLEAARDAYTAALGLEPDDAPTLLRLAEVELDLARPDRAAELFEQARSAGAEPAATSFGLGRAAAAEERHTEAVEHFEAALRAQPDATAVHYPLGLAHRALGNGDAASIHLAERGDLEPSFSDPLTENIGRLVSLTALEVLTARVEGDDFDPVSDLGFALSQLAGIGGAVEQMEQRATALPDQPGFAARWWYLAGAFRADGGQDDRAEANLRRALDLDPSLHDARLKLGNALARSGRFEPAVDAYSAVVRDAPEGSAAVASAHERRGAVLANLGRFEDAITDYRRAADLAPQDADVALRLAAVLGHVGRLAEAAEVYAAAVQAAPTLVAARHGEVTALLLLGRRQGAAEKLEAAVAALPDEPSIVHALARLRAASPEADLRDGQLALELAQRAFEAERTLDRAETLAMAHAEAGDFESARQLQGRLVEEATALGRTDVTRALRQRLEAYERERPFRAEGPGDLIVSPPVAAGAG
ncbi:MAG: tetratricopeptide repeat protein [Acidobacteriota bacterium]